MNALFLLFITFKMNKTGYENEIKTEVVFKNKGSFQRLQDSFETKKKSRLMVILVLFHI